MCCSPHKAVCLLSPIHPNPNPVPHIQWKTFPVWLVVSVNTVVTKWWKGAEGPSLLFPLLSMFPLWPVGGDPGKQLDNRSQMLFSQWEECWSWYLGSISAGLLGKCFGDEKITGVNIQGDGLQYIDNIKGLDMILRDSVNGKWWEMQLFWLLIIFNMAVPSCSSCETVNGSTENRHAC